MLLITIFVELHVVTGRSRGRAGSPQAVSRLPCCAVVLRRTAWSEHGMGMAGAWHGHGRGMAWAWQGHGMGMAGAWHGKGESDTAALCKSNGKDTF